MQLPAPLQTNPFGQPAFEVHLEVHCLVASLQTFPEIASAHNASVEQVQKVDVEFAILAHVFSAVGQSPGPLQVGVHRPVIG